MEKWIENQDIEHGYGAQMKYLGDRQKLKCSRYKVVKALLFKNKKNRSYNFSTIGNSQLGSCPYEFINS